MTCFSHGSLTYSQEWEVKKTNIFLGFGISCLFPSFPPKFTISVNLSPQWFSSNFPFLGKDSSYFLILGKHCFVILFFPIISSFCDIFSPRLSDKSPRLGIKTQLFPKIGMHSRFYPRMGNLNFFL